MVIGSARRNIPLIEARDCNGDPITSDYEGNVGKDREPFYLLFGEDWSTGPCYLEISSIIIEQKR